MIGLQFTCDQPEFKGLRKEKTRVNIFIRRTNTVECNGVYVIRETSFGLFQA